MNDVGEWDFSPVGYPPGSVMYTGPMLFPTGFSAGTTSMGMIVFGPGGAKANFPAVAEGKPGLPPQINFSQVQLPYGTALPQPSVTVVDPGANGTQSIINLTIYTNAGEPGPEQNFYIRNAVDLASGLADGNVIVYKSGTGLFTPQAPKVGGVYSVFNIAATAAASTAQRGLTAVNIPPQPWAWWPEVEGQAVVTNAYDTRVDLIAYLGAVSNNVIVGRAYGAGNGVGNVTQTMIGAFGSDMPGSTQYGQVSANVGATVTFRAENQVSSTSQWSTGPASFKVKVCPVP